LPYSFSYDLTRVSQSAVKQILETAHETGVTNLLSNNAKKLARILKLDQITGLNLAEAITLVEDFIEVQNANNFKSDIFLEKNEDRVNAKSIMGVMMLAAATGSKIKVIVEGDDEIEALDQISKILESDIDSEVQS